ncbi:MAG: AMP-binding protein [Acidimicrobiales bacterium]
MSIPDLLTTRFTFAAELAGRAAATPDKTFLHFDDAPLTFREAQGRVRSAANQLLQLGVAPGDTVALLTLSCAEWVAVWLACAEIGAVSMPINVMFHGEYLRHQLADAKAKVMLVDDRFVPQVGAVAAALPELETLIVRGAVPAAVDGAPALKLVDAALLADGPVDAIRGGRPFAWNEPSCLFYTSGTTGPSKGAMLTQQYLCASAHVLGDSYGLTADDVVYSAMPLFHLGGAYAVIVSSLVSGRTAILDAAFSVSACWDRIRDRDATVFLGVGPMVAMLATLAPDDRDADLPIRLIVAAPVPAPLQAVVEARYRCTVAQAYGQTEAIPVALTRVGAGNAPGSAGQLSPLHDVRIVDDDDAELSRGAVGEIAIRPRFPHVMFEGYRNQPAATLEQMRNLWFHTGDLGRVDDAGNLWWVDRKKDAIRRRGENISSFEVEQAVITHTAVAECAAHAVPSDIGEDEVKICVVAVDGAHVEPKELMDHCVERLPAFALPRYIELFDALPKNAVGRVQKHVLREHPTGPATWDRVTAGYEVKG